VAIQCLGNKYQPYNEDAQLATRIAKATGARIYGAPLFNEGGAIHSDGQGTLLTMEQTLLNVNRNANLTQQEVEEILALYTGARRVIWLGEGFSDEETDGHVDNIACFVAPGRVVVGMQPSKSHPTSHRHAKSCAASKPRAMRRALRSISSRSNNRVRNARTGTVV